SRTNVVHPALPSVLRLLSRHELDTDRRADLKGVPGGRQAAGFLIYAKHNDIVGILVCGQQIPAAGIDAEAAGRPALSRNVFDASEFSGPFVNAKCHDAIVTAIRAVKESAGRMRFDFGGAEI